MLLLGFAAAWLVLTRPVHRIEGDFLKREDRLVADPWIFEQLRHPVAEIRARAVLAISRIQGSDALGLLVEAMGDPAPSVRASAAFAAGNVLDSRAGGRSASRATVSALLGLLADEDRLVGTRAVAALGKLGRPETAAALTRTAAPITTAMTALMRLDAADQSDFVAEYLDSDDQDSRWSAALAAADLRLAPRPLVSERLRPLLSDANEFVRAAALRAVSFGPVDPVCLRPCGAILTIRSEGTVRSGDGCRRSGGGSPAQRAAFRRAGARPEGPCRAARLVTGTARVPAGREDDWGALAHEHGAR